MKELTFTVPARQKVSSHARWLIAFVLPWLPTAKATTGNPPAVWDQVTEGWGPRPARTSDPQRLVQRKTPASAGQTGLLIEAMVYNPDPKGTGIVYSNYADNPDVENAALVTLAGNLGNDPVRIYEWVRNNISSEFYYGCARGAYLTYLEGAGNDIDQCALLGALLKAAKYTPTYRLEQIWVPRSATGANRVGIQEWLGVSDDASMLHLLDNFSPVINSDQSVRIDQMWVSITLPTLGEVKFVPSIKTRVVGRKPNLDTLTGYTWNGVTSISDAAGGSSSSTATNSAAIRGKLATLARQASDAIRSSVSQHDLSGAELAHLPVIVPELVSLTAPAATEYPSGLTFTTNAASTALSGIPVSYCSRLNVRAGTVDHSFECSELLGQSLVFEFDPSGRGVLRQNGAEIFAESSGSSSGTIAMELVYQYPAAYFSGTTPTVAGSITVARQNAVAIIYSFGRTLGRLQKTLNEISTKEASAATSVTISDRLRAIGLQYASQANELVTLGTASLEYDAHRTFLGGFAHLGSGGAPGVHLPISIFDINSRSPTAPPASQVAGAACLLLGALEGTAIEQTSSNRSFGTPSLFDYATTQNRGAKYFAASSQIASAGLQNYNDSSLGAGATTSIANDLNAGKRIVLLTDSNVPFGNLSFGGYLRINPANGYVSTIIKGAMGGVTTGPTGTLPFLSRLWTSVTRFVKTIFSQVPTVSSDPVDLATGAFYKDDTDLVVGNGNSPVGLRLDRHYSSASRMVDPTGLGRGWNHSYNIKLDIGSPIDLDSLRADADAVLPILVAMRFAQDSIANEPQAARTWLMSSTALSWAADQQINTRANITMGSRALEFVKRPDASYVPSSSLTASLVRQSDGSHDLAFRYGNTVHFRASDGKFTTIKDPYTNTLTATYDGSNRLSTVTDAYSRSFTFKYDGADRLYQIDDSTGRNVKYGRDGTTFTFTDAENKTSKMEMTSDFLLTKVIDARSRTVVENFYDDQKRVYEQHILGDGTDRVLQLGIVPGVGIETDPLGYSTRAYFDARGRKIYAVDQLGRLSSWTYDGVDRVVKVIDPVGATASFGYDANHELIRETNPAGDTRTITPETAQNSTRTIRNFEGKETSIVYTAEHAVSSMTTPGGVTTSFEYDTLGRLKSRLAPPYSAKVKLENFDSYGNAQRISYPRKNVSTGAIEYIESFSDVLSYNARGDLTDLVDRVGAYTSFAYNARRETTTVTGHASGGSVVSETAYDDAGEVDYVIDASGRKTDYDYNALGDLLTVKRGPSATQVTTLTNIYDRRNALESSTDALGNTTSYAYDAAGRLKTVTDPLLRVTTFAYIDNTTAHTVARTTMTPLGEAASPQYKTTEIYNVRGLIDSVTDAETQTSIYDYDKDGRITTLENRRQKGFTWTYTDAQRKIVTSTATGKQTTAIADALGRVQSITEPLNTTTFSSYDPEGRLLTRSDGVGATTFNYYDNGLLNQVTESAHTTSRGYDDLNRLTSYQDGEGRTFGYLYNASGQLSQLTYPGGTKVVTYLYDDFGRLHTVTDSNRVTTYTYNSASQLTRIDYPNETWRIQEYDVAGQLRFLKDYKSDGSIFLFQEFKYDKDGRIESAFVHPKPAVLTLPPDSLSLYDDDNRLGKWNSLNATHDNGGNMTYGPLPSGTMGTYVFDARSRLTSAGGTTYRYNPDGIRVEVTGTGAASYAVDPNAALSRTLVRTVGGTVTYYVYGIGLLYEETNGAARTYHFNQVGSTLAITSNGTTVTDTVSYSPYGKIAQRTGTTDTPFLFHGELGVTTDANGLNCMRARYYNPRLMRFVNADPIQFAGGMNWYAAFGNNPISLVDPLGLKDSKGLKRADIQYGKLVALEIVDNVPKAIRELPDAIWNPDRGHYLLLDFRSAARDIKNNPLGSARDLIMIGVFRKMSGGSFRISPSGGGGAGNGYRPQITLSVVELQSQASTGYRFALEELAKGRTNEIALAMRQGVIIGGNNARTILELIKGRALEAMRNPSLNETERRILTDLNQSAAAALAGPNTSNR